VPSFKAAMADSEAQLAIGWVALNLIMLWVMVTIGEKRWRAKGIDIDDRQPLD
jgi:hypothetical protein